MPATPAKALILYSHTRLGPSHHVPAVHDLCKRGCAGQLMLENGLDNATRRAHMIQLLGLAGCDSTEQMRKQLRSRFGKLKLGLVSDAPEIRALADALEIPHFNSVSFDRDVDCWVVDSQWDVINDTLKAYLDSTPDVLKCVVMPATPAPRPVDRRWQAIAPQQSCVTKNGERVDVSERESLVCAYLHEGSTRRDDTTEFSAEQIQQRGCNGSILAWHYLAEIGQKLGHVPKYGA